MNKLTIQLSCLHKTGERELLLEEQGVFDEDVQTDIIGEKHFLQKCQCQINNNNQSWSVEAFYDDCSCLNVRVFDEGKEDQIFFYIGTVDLSRDHTFLVNVPTNLEMFVLLCK